VSLVHTALAACRAYRIIFRRLPVAKRKTLFDDRPVEISELTYIIRQDISSLNAQIAQLQQHLRASQAAAAAGKGKAKAEGQVEEHNSNVVMMLQSRLASMGMGFKDVLELRTQVRDLCLVCLASWFTGGLMLLSALVSVSMLCYRT
jgi:hypothetical protein